MLLKFLRFRENKLFVAAPSFLGQYFLYVALGLPKYLFGLCQPALFAVSARLRNVVYKHEVSKFGFTLTNFLIGSLSFSVQDIS